MKILVIDIGGTHVKLMLSGEPGRRKFNSGPKLTPKQMVQETLAMTADWTYDAVSIGFPAPVRDGKPIAEPHHLAPGWVGLKFDKYFKKPVKIINDAALQALGGYNGGRMLFLGLGTGLGSAMILHDSIIPLELCGLKYSRRYTIEDMLGKEGLARLGAKRWERTVSEVTAILKKAFLADDIVIGGGNAKSLKKPPAGTRLGDNSHALIGGERLWDKPAGQPRPHAWQIA